jgi:hypothetical protein
MSFPGNYPFSCFQGLFNLPNSFLLNDKWGKGQIKMANEEWQMKNDNKEWQKRVNNEGALWGKDIREKTKGERQGKDNRRKKRGYRGSLFFFTQNAPGLCGR